jgi:FkbM family methyltransferase
MRAAEAEAHAMGRRRLLLGAYARNGRAIAHYRKAGLAPGRHAHLHGRRHGARRLGDGARSELGASPQARDALGTAFMNSPAWTPPLTIEERLKRLLVPPRLELARVTARELKKGEPELRLAQFLADPSRAAIDAGANRGIWAHVLARVCPKVYAFEPNPKLFAVLRAAAPRNVECFAYGLSDADGEARLMVPGEGVRFSNQGATLNPAKVEGQAFRETLVETRRLDALSLDPVGFIKIDVEGHELSVLRGGAALIARDKPTLIVEMEERHTKRPLRDALQEVRALGYRMLYLGAHGLQDGDALDPEHPPASPRGVPVNNFIFLPI